MSSKKNIVKNFDINALFYVIGFLYEEMPEKLKIAFIKMIIDANNGSKIDLSKFENIRGYNDKCAILFEGYLKYTSIDDRNTLLEGLYHRSKISSKYPYNDLEILPTDKEIEKYEKLLTNQYKVIFERHIMRKEYSFDEDVCWNILKNIDFSLKDNLYSYLYAYANEIYSIDTEKEFEYILSLFLNNDYKFKVYFLEYINVICTDLGSDLTNEQRRYLNEQAEKLTSILLIKQINDFLTNKTLNIMPLKEQNRIYYEFLESIENDTYSYLGLHLQEKKLKK